jgi:hypothetical protein
MVFLGGAGGGRESVMSRSEGSVFTGRRVLLNSPIFYVIYYILSSGGFTVTSSDHREGVSDPRCPGKTRVLFKFRLLHLVPTRTPRNSGYGVLYTFYVTCYFS